MILIERGKPIAVLMMRLTRTVNCELAHLPNRIDPLSIPNDVIRCDEWKMKMSCSRDDRSIGWISNDTKTKGLKEDFNCIRLDLEVRRMV